MPAGRKPEPQHLRVIKGEARPSRTRPAPKADAGIPRPPAGMSAQAAAEWKRVVPLLTKRGNLTLLDRAALWAYCEAWSRALTATKAFNAGSPVVKSQNDRGGKKNPAAQIARDAATELRIWCDEFGMTPSSRGRMAAPPEEEDEIERLIAPPRRR